MLSGPDRAARLLTLVGPGGTGKTRLAIAVASRLLEQFADGVAFVDLAPVDDPRQVPWAVTRALGLTDPGTRPVLERVLQFIGDRELLLVLDNFEHLLQAAGMLAELLAGAPRLTMLVTSRARLQLRWEQVLPVPTLEVPDLRRIPPVEVLAAIPSVDLFLRRARTIDPAFGLTRENAASVAELCVRLDGLPLALELAAARIDVLPPRAMLAQPLDLLVVEASDVPPRHTTLRRAIGWSYDQLSAQEQALFRRLAIVPASFDADGATAVGGVGALDILSALVAKSLLRQERQPDGEPRFGMLETIRAFAIEHLAQAGELEATGRRFRDFYLSLVERAELELIGPHQTMWLDRLEREHDSICAAMRWCRDRGEAEEGLRLASAMWRFWFIRQHLGEGDRWLCDLLGVVGTSEASVATRAKALNGAGNLAQARGDLERAARMHHESLSLRQLLDDRRGIAISLNSLGNVVVDSGDHLAARVLYEDSLAIRRELGDKRGIAVALNNLSVIARDEAEWRSAAALSEESAALFRELGDTQGVALSLVTLSVATYQLGCHAEADALYRESLTLFAQLDSKRDIAEWLEVLGILACTQDSPARAAFLFGAADGAVEQIGSSMGPARHVRYKRYVEQVQRRLSDHAFATEWNRGRAMRLEDALAEALTPDTDTAQAVRPATVERNSRAPLTRREQQVLALLARGLTNREIASELVITERTAETHVGRILAKLGLSRRAQLTAWAIKHGM